MPDVSITPLRVADAYEMAEVLSDPALYAFISGRPLQVDDLRAFYARLVGGLSPDGTTRWMNWIVREDGHAVGYVQASAPVEGRRANIAWVIGAPWQRRGLALTAAQLMLRELDDLGLQDVFAYIHPGNVASQKVATRLGMHRTGDTDDGDEEWTAPYVRG